MKKLLLILFLFVSYLTLNAQTVIDSIHIQGYLPISHTDATQWIQRYQPDIDKYEEENKKMTDFSCDVLCMGSSSINLWHNIYNDLAPLKVIRRSYGGATIRDMIYNYNTIARGYKPKSILLYVENDLCTCDEGLSVGDIYDLFRLFTQTIQRDYPDIPFYILSFKPSVAKKDVLNNQLAINSLLEDYAKKTNNVFYIDITAGMYDEKRNLRQDIFLPDNLHMNQKGYDTWTTKIKPILMNNTIDK